MKYKIGIITLVLGTAVLLSGCSGLSETTSQIEQQQILEYQVINQEELEKGVGYTLITADVIIDPSQANFSNESVEATLSKVLEDIKKTEKPDGISLLAYHRQEEVAQGLGYTLGMAEWWPKGHSFSVSNEENIENKATYETKIQLVDNTDEEIPTEQEYAIYDAFIKLGDSDENPILEEMPEGMTEDEFLEWAETSNQAQDAFEQQSLETVADEFSITVEEVEAIVNKVMQYKL